MRHQFTSHCFPLRSSFEFIRPGQEKIKMQAACQRQIAGMFISSWPLRCASLSSFYFSTGFGSSMLLSEIFTHDHSKCTRQFKDIITVRTRIRIHFDHQLFPCLADILFGRISYYFLILSLLLPINTDTDKATIMGNSSAFILFGVTTAWAAENLTINAHPLKLIFRLYHALISTMNFFCVLSSNQT